MVVRDEVGINEGGHGAEDDVAGSLDAAGEFIPGSDYRSLGGEVGVGYSRETFGRDAIVYKYEGSYIRHTLLLPLLLSAIIVTKFSLVNTNIDRKI